MRVLSGALVAAALGSCTLIDSVDGYAGPEAQGASGGNGGSGGQLDAAPDVSTACTRDEECFSLGPCQKAECWGGLCRYSALAGVSCADDDVCNGEEICDAEGKCPSGTPLTLDDGDACTDDACDPKLGVTHVPQATPPKLVLQCKTINCPPGYFVRKLTCLSDCGACDPTFCVNGVLCERICQNTLNVCCGNECNGDCPSGFTQTASGTSGDCGCGPGLVATCSR